MDIDMANWIEEGGIPHNNGKIKWYAVGLDESVYYYVGEFDMTDWDKTIEEVIAKADEYMNRCFRNDFNWQILRKDHLVDLMWNVAGCLRESGEFKNEWLEMDIFDEEEE